jgi:hypothetical protein
MQTLDLRMNDIGAAGAAALAAALPQMKAIKEVLLAFLCVYLFDQRGASCLQSSWRRLLTDVC